MRASNVRRAVLNAEAGGRSARSAGANQTRQAISQVDWTTEEWVRRHGQWALYTHESLDFMAVYVDEEIKVIVVHPDTWETVAYEETAVGLLFRDMTKGGSGMKFICADVGPYALAARKRAEAEGTDVSAGRDALEDLTHRAQALVEQAAALNRTPSELQLQVFTQKYAGLERDWAALQEKVTEIRSLITFAGTAVFDTTR